MPAIKRIYSLLGNLWWSAFAIWDRSTTDTFRSAYGTGLTKYLQRVSYLWENLPKKISFDGNQVMHQYFQILQAHHQLVRNRSHDVSVIAHQIHRQSIKDKPPRPLHTAFKIKWRVCRHGPRNETVCDWDLTQERQNRQRRAGFWSIVVDMLKDQAHWASNFSYHKRTSLQSRVSSPHPCQ